MKMSKDRNIYLSNTDLEDAKKIFFTALSNMEGLIKEEEIAVVDALGYISSQGVFASNSSPHFSASAMDGIAIDAQITYGAGESSPKRLKKNIDFKYVDTGDVIDGEYNSVIMIEDVIDIDDEWIEILKPSLPWQNVRPIGEDIVANELIIPSNHKIGPVDMAALLAGGVTKVKVYKKPVIGIIPTGTELVKPGSNLKPGDLVEFNSTMFKGMVEELGAMAMVMPIVKDDYHLIKETILTTLTQCDALIINAGSSAGSEDFTSKIIAETGQLLLHGVATKPGKPAILGIVNNKPVIGIPGYPVSAYFVFNFFVKPLVAFMTGSKERFGKKIKAVLSRTVVSSLKYQEYVRIKLGKVGERLIATPLNRGAGVVMSLVRADGVLVIPKNLEGIEAGQEVDIELLKEIEDIENTLVCIGSHDPLLDLLSDEIQRAKDGFFLSSAHVGSMGAIMSLRKGECHFGCIHLLDPQSGQYNTSYVKKYFKEGEVAIIKFVRRLQGLMVQKSNPKNIKELKDIARADVSFVNRQRGAGTRVLLDYSLNHLKIDPETIRGYEREELTHMTVAAAVAGGTADCGLGVFSASQIMKLDFIPIDNEEYDIIIPTKFLNTPMVKALLNTLNSSEFKDKITSLGGYDVTDCGKIIVV
jgi:putative molybdopterin biosynthesis protein